MDRPRYNLPRRGLFKGSPAITHGVLCDVSSLLEESSDLFVREHFTGARVDQSTIDAFIAERLEALMLNPPVRSEKKKPGLSREEAIDFMDAFTEMHGAKQ